MRTRKEIGDKYGERSLYVVERRYRKSKRWVRWSNGHPKYRDAYDEKKFYARKYGKIYKYRTALYGRLE